MTIPDGNPMASMDNDGKTLGGLGFVVEMVFDYRRDILLLSVRIASPPLQNHSNNRSLLLPNRSLALRTSQLSALAHISGTSDVYCIRPQKFPIEAMLSCCEMQATP